MSQQSAVGDPALNREAGLDSLYRSLPTSTILWFLWKHLKSFVNFLLLEADLCICLELHQPWHAEKLNNYKLRPGHRCCSPVASSGLIVPLLMKLLKNTKGTLLRSILASALAMLFSVKIPWKMALSLLPTKLLFCFLCLWMGEPGLILKHLSPK